MDLLPAEEHFFKKYLLRRRLEHELALLATPDCCERFGAPFRSARPQPLQFPLLRHFFDSFVATFPFIASNLAAEQRSIWQDTVQPFVQNLNLKAILRLHERLGNATKRRQVNKKLLLGLLLFYNSMVVGPQEMQYLEEARARPLVAGKLERLAPPAAHAGGGGGGGGLSLDVVAVRRVATEPVAFYWRPFRDAPTHHYEFVVEVTRDGATHYVARAYHQFGELEVALKKQFPGLVGTALPRKMKNDEGVAAAAVMAPKLEASEVLAVLSEALGAAAPALHREKLRLALRGYLRALALLPEIHHSPPFTRFLTADPFDRLSSLDAADRAQRAAHERQMLATQYEFHQQTSQVLARLAADFNTFKRRLVRNPATLTDLFREIGASDSVEQLSPLLRTFLEWSKLEVAATLYQVFLGQDRAGEWLAKCRKFHRMFPYGLVYGILRFTNPMKVVSRVVDLLLASLPSWRHDGHAHNLLLMIFVMLLDEDLGGYASEIEALEREVAERWPWAQVLLERVTAYLELDAEAVEAIRRESVEGGDLVMAVVETARLAPAGGEAAARVRRAYEAAAAPAPAAPVAVLKAGAAAAASPAASPATAPAPAPAAAGAATAGDAALYLHLKQYLHLQLRRRDKNLMKELWQEPELLKLIKKFLIIFYKPLMKVFGRSDIHLVFRDFQRLMDELMEMLTRLSDGEVYLKSLFELFEMLKQLLDRHQVVFWRFVHNLYKRDDEELFLGLVKWIERFLVALRRKYTAGDVTLNVAALDAPLVDRAALHSQIRALAAYTLARRQLYKQFLDLRANAKTPKPHTQDDIDRKWDELNDQVFGSELHQWGLNDLEDYNLDVAFDDAENHTELERELQRRLHALEARHVEVGTSELDKFDGAVRFELQKLLYSGT